MLKVQKHILECQNEVKTNIFNEAFSLINDHAFHHPDDHATIDIHGHDDFAHRNFTLTEQEILKFFEHHDRPSLHGTAGKLSAAGSGHLGSSVEVSHEDPHSIESHSHEHHPIEHHPIDHHHLAHQPESDSIAAHHPIPNPHAHAWHQQSYPIESLYKKTDAVQLDNKSEDETQRQMRALTAKRNPYTYFNIKTGEAVKNGDRPRRDIHDIHAFDHHSSDVHDLHSSDVHPTTATFKDKRIAGVSDIVASAYDIDIDNLRSNLITFNAFNLNFCLVFDALPVRKRSCDRPTYWLSDLRRLNNFFVQIPPNEFSH